MVNKSIFIVGPTASGKTALAIAIAKKYNGEIICADSRTIYRGLDIGTAKPTKDEQCGIKHYGLDLVNPDETFSAAEFAKNSRVWMEDIKNRGKIPIIVGGTGLYIDAIYYGYSFVDKADLSFRQELDKLSIEELQSMIGKNGYEMPENYKNKRYLIRTIERAGSKGFSKMPDKNSIIIGIYPGKEVLVDRINKRAKIMFESGVMEECEWLFGNYGYDAPGGSGNIYRAIAPHFQQGISTKECLENFNALDRKLAKRQMTWFKRNKDIKWFENGAEAERYIGSIL